MPTDAPNVLSIETADWQPALGAIGAVVEDLDDIDQCIRTILLTPKGSVPHEPEFGSDLWRYIDWPIGEARPNVVREIVDAVARWEPRVEIAAVSFDVAEDDPSNLVIQLTRRRAGSIDAGSVLTFEISR